MYSERMNRRSFITTVTCGLLGAPFASKAQTGTTVRRIGYLESGVPATPAELKQSWGPLREIGWIEGKNLLVERRYADGKAELLRPLAE